ncbi:hypothetical protein L5515_007222 [Caenorhabditis briggsae]|uniref:Uncharacterized protein n=1 Tax=Caenorhabditis briggsae TaxID=6238 RepID=A0AAE9EXX3_CAEBR|nr:hypothetical protein L5515_007222 [Caenorhabditis briggsae]
MLRFEETQNFGQTVRVGYVCKHVYTPKKQMCKTKDLSNYAPNVEVCVMKERVSKGMSDDDEKTEILSVWGDRCFDEGIWTGLLSVDELSQNEFTIANWLGTTVINVERRDNKIISSMHGTIDDLEDEQSFTPFYG